jgi:hypothetical protein
VLLFLVACDTPACLDGDPTCEMPTPCPELSFTCEGGSSEVYVLEAGQHAPGGTDALYATGDVVLANDQVVVVIDALEHPHYIAPTGGSILDMSIRGKDNDSLRHIETAIGLLPEEAVAYTDLRLIDDGEVKGVQLLGTLAGYPDVPIATRYEIRPCEPGVRVRTEVANGTADALSLYLTDAFYWGGRENLPFTPRVGGGFLHPSFGLSTIADAFFDVPFMVAGMHAPPAATYGVLSCDEPAVVGFQSENISALGEAPRVFPSRDWEVYERFIFATDGATIHRGVDLALELREQLWGEAWITISGRVEAAGGTIGQTMRASLQLDATDGTPWTHIVPDADGSFAARVPAGQDYVLRGESFGKEVVTVDVAAGDADVDVGTVTLPAVGEVTIDVLVDGVSDHAVVMVIPSDDATLEAVRATQYGFFEECAPMIGLTHGGSPACNRVLVNGPTTVALPDGTYDFYTSRGMFSTLGSQRGVRVDSVTAQTVALDVVTLDLQPEGTLSADFHVHGGASFDAQIPDTDRVKAFVASGLDVVVSTEHDVVNDYADALAEVGVADRMIVVAGTESTGHILFPIREDFGFPQVVGHWMFWPVTYDPLGPYRGASWDELALPGALMTRQRDAGWDDVGGIAQLNHPYGGSQFGRDYAWATAAGFDQTRPLVEQYDGTGQSLFFQTPDGADFSNADYDVQEVMNGTKNENLLQYRAFWFWLLEQDIVRGGTANSDSHSLVENVLGTPRNLVYTDTTADNFDLAAFNADVREGHILGTNGPVVEATIGDRRPGTEPFVYDPAAVLRIVVRAAPWVPVDEVRVVVNGAVALTIDDLPAVADPFGSDGLDRLDVELPLADLLVAGEDAWVVIEAGHALVEQADLDCDGVPDTGDNNGDGVFDWQDVAELTEDPGEDCFTTVGPLGEPPEPERDSPDWVFRTVTPNGYPAAFTNPFLVDVTGDGYARGN